MKLLRFERVRLGELEFHVLVQFALLAKCRSITEPRSGSERVSNVTDYLDETWSSYS